MQDDWEIALNNWCNFKIEYEDAETAKGLTAEEVNEAAKRSKTTQQNMMQTLRKKKALNKYTDSENEQENELNSDSEDDVDNTL